MRKSFLTVFCVVPLLICCSSNATLERNFFCFDTFSQIKLVNAKNENLDYIENVFSKLDMLCDNYQDRNCENVYRINKTNDEIKIDEDLYDLMKTSFELSKQGLNNLNILCGGLIKLWKNSLNNQQIPDKSLISLELEKIKNSSLIFKDNFIIQRVGNAEIDLGAVTKGFVLDKAFSYLNENKINNYLINNGYSSILLGEKENNQSFVVSINGLTDVYLNVKNAFISTSGTSEQKWEIDGTTYSHIVNPANGSAISLYDLVIVVSNNGFLGDALSTSLSLSTLEEIKEAETKFNVKCIVIKNKSILYRNEYLELFQK